jgi:hypothetical protein
MLKSGRSASAVDGSGALIDSFMATPTLSRMCSNALQRSVNNPSYGVS